MRTCQTAANEFLRQFWSAVYPPMDGTVPLSAPQKNAKISKMTGYLAKTPEKVNAIINTARQSGLNAAKIEVVSIAPLINRIALFTDDIQAMRPVLAAVEKALQFSSTMRDKPKFGGK